MPIYIGSQEYNLFLGDKIKLLTSDGLMLTDLNDTFLISGGIGGYHIQLLGLNHKMTRNLNEKEDE